MLDLNHILLFVAIVSPLILLVRIARLRNPRNRGWRIAASIVLAACVVGWWLVPYLAGYIGGIFWCLLLVIPSLAERGIDTALRGQRFARARQIATLRRILHPWNDTPFRASLLQALEFAGGGRLDLALDRLAAERQAQTPTGRFATALTFALTENWGGLVQWCRRDLSIRSNPAVSALYLRALGEIGALDELVLEFASQVTTYEPEEFLNSPLGFNFLIVLAFAGETQLVMRLCQSRFSEVPRAQQEFWVATAELAEGKGAPGRQRLEKLRRETKDPVLRRSVEHRLVSPPPGHLSARGEMLLNRLTTELGGTQKLVAGQEHGAPAVWALILLNIAMFGVEVLLGGPSNPLTLRALGALEPAAVLVRHEYWRLLTSLFLHYNLLHIAINLYALYLLGPALERMIGSLKFLLSYLICGLGSGAGVVLLRVMNLTQADQLVGASGCVMGVIGISAGLLLRHRQSPLAGRRLRNILVIVAIQTAFDLSTPQVSLGAHLSGFVTGVAVGVLLASQHRVVPY